MVVVTAGRGGTVGSSNVGGLLFGFGLRHGVGFVYARKGDFGYGDIGGI